MIEPVSKTTIFQFPDQLISEPTCRLRWRNGKLQQAHKLTAYREGMPVGISTEWKDVPVEDAND